MCKAAFGQPFLFIVAKIWDIKKALCEQGLKILQKITVFREIEKYLMSLLTGILSCNTFGVVIVAKHL